MKIKLLVHSIYDVKTGQLIEVPKATEVGKVEVSTVV